MIPLPNPLMPIAILATVAEKQYISRAAVTGPIPSRLARLSTDASPLPRIDLHPRIVPRGTPTAP